MLSKVVRFVFIISVCRDTLCCSKPTQIFVKHFHTWYLTSLPHNFVKKPLTNHNPHPWTNQGPNSFSDKSCTSPRTQSKLHRCWYSSLVFVLQSWVVICATVLCFPSAAVQACPPVWAALVVWCCQLHPSGLPLPNATPNNIIGLPRVPLERSLCCWEWGLVWQMADILWQFVLPLQSLWYIWRLIPSLGTRVSHVLNCMCNVPQWKKNTVLRCWVT